MNVEKITKEYLPMSETAYYILLALLEVRHGYGIMQYVENITGGRIRIGAGTLYGTLSRMEKDGLIDAVAEEDRRKLYVITDTGRMVLRQEIGRLRELYENGIKYGEGNL